MKLLGYASDDQVEPNIASDLLVSSALMPSAQLPLSRRNSRAGARCCAKPAAAISKSGPLERYILV